MGDENKSNTHREELIAARNSLAEKLAAREQLDIEIAKEQRRIAALTTLVNESEEIDELLNLNLGGLTDAVRSVFMASSSYGLSPKEVRDRLIHLCFPVNEYKNFMASLHTVLGRLNKGGEIKLAIIDRHDGRDESVYQWIPKYTHPADGMSLASDLKNWNLGDDKPKTLTHSVKPGTKVNVSKKKR